MLYLEDYLEMIEHLPQELRDRFTEMREMDLSVQNNMDELEKRVKVFFNECKKFPKGDLPQNLELDFKAIEKEYYKTLEDADEKVHMANQMYELVDKYLRRLDTELHKFKCELEADNKGITEVLEKRSLELDVPMSMSTSSQQQKENRYESFRYRPRHEKRRETSSAILTNYVEKRETAPPTTSAETRYSPVVQPPPANIGYNLVHIGAGPAIAAAASQAIAATQHMQQGRRTASLKASYEAINTGSHGNEFNIGRELAGAAQTAIQAIQQDHANNKKKQKKVSTSNTSTSAIPSIGTTSSTTTTVAETSADTAAQNSELTDGEWTYDPNEPRYCLCNQVSYGDMVACDNEDCPSEWFHYPCVGITAPPKGKWYCPECTSSMKRRRKT